MVTLRTDSDDWGVLPRPAAGMWTRIADSPASRAVANALDGWTDNLSPVDASTPVDVRKYIRAATQPLENLRAELNMFGFPDGDYLGETFQRRVGANRISYYQRRNTASLVVEFAAQAEFLYILTWTPPSGGPRTAMNICVTPSGLLGDSTGFATFVTEWLEWSYPWFSNGGVTVTICPLGETDVVAGAVGLQIINQIAEVG